MCFTRIESPITIGTSCATTTPRAHNNAHRAAGNRGSRARRGHIATLRSLAPTESRCSHRDLESHGTESLRNLYHCAGCLAQPHLNRFTTLVLLKLVWCGCPRVRVSPAAPEHSKGRPPCRRHHRHPSGSHIVHGPQRAPGF